MDWLLYKQAVLDLLEADPMLAQYLGRYEGKSSIFGAKPIPDGAELPAVVVAGADRITPLPNKSSNMFEVAFGVEVWAEADDDPISVELASAHLAAQLHRTRLDVPGYTVITFEVSGPDEADQTDYYGRDLTVVSQVARRE